MGNVNELHEREAESSDDVETSSPESNSSSHSISTSEQESLDISENHHHRSIINFSLGTSSDISDQSNDDAFGHSVNNSSSDSLPLPIAILPSSFDLLEESIGSPNCNDALDSFLTPETSHDGMERKADSLQNAHFHTVGILPQMETQVKQQIPVKEIVQPEGLASKSGDRDLSKVIPRAVSDQVDAEVHVSQQQTKFDDPKSEFKEQSNTKDTCNSLTAEYGLNIEPSNSMILHNKGPSIIHTSINPDKSGSGMTSFAEHLNANSLEESLLQPHEDKDSAHTMKRESEYALSEGTQDETLPEVEDILLNGSFRQKPEGNVNASSISECPATESDRLESCHDNIPEQTLQKAPLSQFDLVESNLEAKDHATLTTKNVDPVSCEDTESALLFAEEALALYDGCQNELAKPREPVRVVQVHVEKTLETRTENSLPDTIKAHSPPKHTADRPNWALAPDSPPNSKPSSSVKRRKRGPRRGKQTDDDAVSASPDALRLPSKQRNSHTGSEARKQPWRGKESICDINTNAMDMPRTALPNESLPNPRLTGYSLSCLPVQIDCNAQIVGELSNSLSLPDAVAHGVFPQMPGPFTDVANVSQSITNVNQSPSPHARRLQHGTEPSMDNAKPISFKQKGKPNHKHTHPSEHGFANALASVGSSIGLHSKDSEGEANRCCEFTSPENSLARNVSLASSVTSHISGKRMPKSSWPSLAEEMRFHALNRTFQSDLRDSSKQTSQEKMFIPALYANSLMEGYHVAPRTTDGSDALVAVTKSRHLVFDESIAIGEGTSNARVNIPSKRSKSMDLETHLQQQGATRPSRPPFQSGIPIPTRGQFHRDPFINLPREPRLSVPEERIVHNVSAQTLVSQNGSLGGSLHRAISQPFMIRRHPIATPSHPGQADGPVPIRPADRNPSFLPESRSKPSNFLPANRYTVRPYANVVPTADTYPTGVVNIHESRCVSPMYQPHYNHNPYTRSYAIPQGERYSMQEEKCYPSGLGPSKV